LLHLLSAGPVAVFILSGLVLNKKGPNKKESFNDFDQQLK
jgi:hypothetical protein